MVIVTARYKVAGKGRAAFLNDARVRAAVAASRGHKGNISYEMMCPVESEEEVLVLERWDSAECVEEHAAQPELKGLREAKAAYGCGQSTVNIFEISGVK